MPKSLIEPPSDLLTMALRAHGGQERWEKIDEIIARVDCGGWAFALRGKPVTYRDIEIRVSPRVPDVVLSPFPSAGLQGRYLAGRVRILSSAGDVLRERHNPRDHFRNFRHKFYWDWLDVLHFAGYAYWNYFCTPFMFTRPGFTLREIESWPVGKKRWRRLCVGFPDDIPTHSREQVYYFDEVGHLRRLDYTAEVFSRWAKAAHYCDEHKVFGGLVIPTRRRIFRRTGHPRIIPPIIWIDIKDVKVRERG